MTDIEAVGALKWKVAYAKEIGKSHIDNVYVEALDLAVKALEERQQGDLISREALKKYARKVMCEKDFMTKIHLELFENIIDNAPTVPPDMAQVLAYESGYHQAKEDVAKRIHNEVCANKVANDGLGGECGFFKAEQPQGDLISRSDLKKAIEEVEGNYDGYEPNDLGRFMNKVDDLIDNAPTIEIPVARWDCYCEGQKVGFKKAEDVFERMKLIQETVDCIRNKFNLNTKSNKLVRNCMALVQNAIDGEYHDMEEVDMKGGAK